MTSAQVVIVALAAVAALFLVFRLVKTGSPADLSTPLQNLNQSLQDLKTQSAVLSERVSKIESLPSAVGSVVLEVRAIAQRLQSVEVRNNSAGATLDLLRNALTATGTKTENVLEAANAIRSELARAKLEIGQISAQGKAREETDRLVAISVRRLESIIAGTQSKGAAGENLLELVLAQLPPEWQVRNFHVNNKICEFGLRLPNRLIIPIDSKWPATALIEDFVASKTQEEQEVLRHQIAIVVAAKARELQKYIDPNLTVSFGIAVIPDAAYDLCPRARLEAMDAGVALVSYSMFVPYLLLVFQMALQMATSIDVSRLEATLKDMDRLVKAVQDEAEGRLARVATMLANSRDEIGTLAGKLTARLGSLAGAAVPPVDPGQLPGMEPPKAE